VKLDEKFPVSPGKVEALRTRIRSLGIDPARIEEQFVKGGGPGGQKVNKTSSAVLLRYAPLGIVVRCRRERSRSLNRFIALRELVDEVEARLRPAESRKQREIERIRLKKSRAHRRARARHASLSEEE
jgi:protein subunit release factor B